MAVRSTGISGADLLPLDAVGEEYGGLRTDQAQRLKELEQENSRLKRIVADLSLDNMIIKEALKVK